MTPTRREFIAAAAVPALSPILLNMQDKSGTRAPVLGAGAFTYEAIHDWGELPANIRWGNTHGVVEDSQGNIYVHHTVHATSEIPDSMVVFDRNGRFIRSWGREFRGVAHGLHIRKEAGTEYLYLTVNSVAANAANPPDIQGAVVKATLKGEIVWRIQGPPDIEAYRTPPQPGTRYNPTNLAVAPNGDVYVADGYGFYYINQYPRMASTSAPSAAARPAVRGPAPPPGPTDRSARSPSRTASGWTHARALPSLSWPTAGTRASSASPSMVSPSTPSRDTFASRVISTSRAATSSYPTCRVE